jgi:hypothetical protein
MACKLKLCREPSTRMRTYHHATRLGIIHVIKLSFGLRYAKTGFVTVI